uniref:ABC transmembrane type-1 domain-containing protein n=1 Tax=Clastoptera arizonana TaxID=38151 RepID=A0A1B6DRZ0_9HEMI
MVLDKEVLEEVPLHDTGHDSNGDVGVKQEAYRYHGVYRKTTPQYIPGKGVSRYSHALRNLIPVRRKTKKKEKLGLDEAGFFSFITYSWMNRFMFKAYKKGFSFDDIPEPSSYDTCDYNAQRLEILWQEEMSKKGPCAASLGSVVWKFIRTRALIATFVLCMNNLIGFVSVVFFMRRLIEYAESSNVRTMDGVIWALCLGLTEVTRVICYATLWAVSFRTASRLRSACLAMLYRKVLRLHSLGDKSIGEIINMFANDGERIFNMIVFGPMVVSGPLSMTLGVLYILWLLSPWALIGMLVFIMFYPVQYGMSRLAGHFQAKVISIADQRIRLTAEILNCIKMIKMYAWEKSFTAALNDIRNKELKFIHRAMYCQSLTVSIASTVPIISAIVMFLSHLAGGYNLTASQAFTVLAYIAIILPSTLTVTKDATRCFVKASRSLQTFKVFYSTMFWDTVKTSGTGTMLILYL